MGRLLHIIRAHIRYKIIMPYLALTVLVTLAGAAIVLVVVASSSQALLSSSLATVARATSDELVRREQNNLTYLRQVAASGASVENNTPAVADAIAGGDTDVVSKTLSVYYSAGISNQTLDFDRLIAFDSRGQSLIDWQRVKDDFNSPPFLNDTTDLSPIPAVKQIISGELVDGSDKSSGLIKFGNDPQPYFFTIAPVRRENDVVGGVMIATKIDRLLLALQRSTQASITTFYDLQGQPTGTTLVPRPDLGTLQLAPEVVAALVDNSAQSIFNVDNPPIFPRIINKRSYEMAYSPLLIGQKQVGYFSVGVPTDFQVDAVSTNRNAISGIALALALGSILLGIRIARNITRPLADLVDTAEAVTAGDLERRTMVQSSDELGRLAQAFNQMTEHLLRLYRTSRELGSSIDVQSVLDVTSRTTESFMPGIEVLALLDDRGVWSYRLRPDAPTEVSALRDLRLSPADPLLRDLAVGRATRIMDDAEPRLAATGLVQGAGFRSLLLTPLVVQESLAGVLIFGSAQPNAFAGALEPTLMAVANMAASVLYNAVLFDRVTEEAHEREAILKSIADGVIVCDQQRNIILVNTTAQQLLGLHDWHLVRRNFNEVPLVRVPVVKDMFGQEIGDLDHYQLGDKVMRLSSAPVIAENGVVLGEVIVLHDISAEAAVDRAKTKFIETVSHELRTPLTPISGNTELLLRGYVGELNAEQRSMLEVVRTRAEQMRDLVNNFVMIASIEANTLLNEPEPQDLWVAIEGVLAPMRSSLAKKGLEARVELPEDLPLVLADREQLRVILTQLLDNARRYTQQGGVTVRASHQDGIVRVDVIDTGPGIPPDEVDRLFTRFYRVEGNNSPERGGGLGLAIARQLVQRQGGQIWVDSTVGHGSTFSFSLLVANEHADAVTGRDNSDTTA
jgi:signal transduction histidine kinase